MTEGGSDRDDESERTSTLSWMGAFEAMDLDCLPLPFAVTPFVSLVGAFDTEFLVDLRADGDGFSRFSGVVTSSSSSFTLFLRGIPCQKLSSHKSSFRLLE